MTVRELMDVVLPCVSRSAPFKELVVALLRYGQPAVVVVDDDGRGPVGIVTEGDLLARQAFGGLAPGDMALRWENDETLAVVASRHLGLTAGDLMSAPVKTIDASANEIEAARRFVIDGYRVLPVLDVGILVGALHRRSVLARFDHPDAAILAMVRSCLDENEAVSRLGVDVTEGVVSLTGQLEGPKAAYELERRVAAMEGVVEVVWTAGWEGSAGIPPTGPSA